MGTAYLIVPSFNNKGDSLMNWVKSLRAWALLMLGQRSQDMEIRGLDADSDQALVEQIQVPCTLINSQRAGGSMQEAGEKFEEKCGFRSLSVILRQELARQGWKAQRPHSLQIPRELHA